METDEAPAQSAEKRKVPQDEFHDEYGYRVLNTANEKTEYGLLNPEKRRMYRQAREFEQAGATAHTGQLRGPTRIEQLQHRQDQHNDPNHPFRIEKHGIENMVE